MIDQITPLILTFNEAPNIGRTLDALKWAERVVVVDSFSTDNTVALCKTYPNVSVVQRVFDNHTAQWNFGLEQAKDSQWVLALDADHVVSPDYVAELRGLDPTNINGYRNGFIYYQDGSPLRGSLYPPLVALFRPAAGHYQQDGHTQRLVIQGHIGDLVAKNYHDDRKSFKRWYQSQWRYAELEAEKMAALPFAQLRTTEKARVIPFISPILVLVYVLVVKAVALNGWPGLKYAGHRVLAECVLHCARVKRWMS